MPFVRCHPHRFHHGPRFHPFMMMHGGPGAFPSGGCRGNAFFEQVLADSLPTNKAAVQETDEAVTIRMDVPGVKAHQITIEEQNGEVEIVAIRMEPNQQVVAQTYQDVLFVDPYKVKMEEAQARLEEGVLLVRFPKKMVASDLVIEPVAMHPPAAVNEESEFRTTEDLPGVKASQLTVKMLSNDTLMVKGERTVGDSTMVMRRKFEIPRGADMAQAKAYMVDGVLTLVAPKIELAATAAGGLRTIYVNEGNEEVMPMVEALQIDVDDDNKKTEDEIMVETVAEEKEWEHVDEDTKPAAKN